MSFDDLFPFIILIMADGIVLVLVEQGSDDDDFFVSNER